MLSLFVLVRWSWCIALWLLPIAMYRGCSEELPKRLFFFKKNRVFTGQMSISTWIYVHFVEWLKGFHDLNYALSLTTLLFSAREHQLTQIFDAELCAFLYVCLRHSARGGVVVKALRYKPAGRGFDSWWCHWNFSVTLSFRSYYGHGIDLSSDRIENQVFFLGLKTAGA